MAHPVLWFEVMGTKGEALREFYGSLFKWTFALAGPGDAYGMANTGDTRGIPGGVGQAAPGGPSWVTFYVETPDIPASLAEAERLGGSTVMPRTVMPDVTIAMFRDPEGHVVGLIEARAA